jgi:hypothetical protein
MYSLCLPKIKTAFTASLLVFIFTWALIAPPVSTGATTDLEARPQGSAGATRGFEERWGVKPIAIRLTARDYFLDFRYRVIDPDKAGGLMRRGKDFYLIDLASGTRLPVPLTKIGPLRASGVTPKKDRNYVIMFSNVDKIIKKGSKVTVVIGNFRSENLTVE